MKSINEIEHILESISVDKGDTFIKRNKRNTNEYFLLEGICRSYLISPEGEEITLSFAQQGKVSDEITVSTKTKNYAIISKK